MKSKNYNRDTCKYFALSEDSVISYETYDNGQIFYMSVTGNFPLEDFYDVMKIKKGYYDITVMKGA